MPEDKRIDEIKARWRKPGLPNGQLIFSQRHFLFEDFATLLGVIEALKSKDAKKDKVIQAVRELLAKKFRPDGRVASTDEPHDEWIALDAALAKLEAQDG